MYNSAVHISDFNNIYYTYGKHHFRWNGWLWLAAWEAVSAVHYFPVMTCDPLRKNKRMHFKTKQQTNWKFENYKLIRDLRMVLSARKEYIGIFCFPPKCVPRTLLICIIAFQIMHFLFVSSINAYKCHIINFLLTSLARSLQRNIGRARSVQKRPRSNISL
jgi:hypothetical protein